MVTVRNTQHWEYPATGMPNSIIRSQTLHINAYNAQDTFINNFYNILYSIHVYLYDLIIKLGIPDVGYSRI